jgi:FlaA1/EpsC-like NDP-sugar epimerase
MQAPGMKSKVPFKRLLDVLSGQSRATKKAIMLVSDFVAIPICLFLAISLRLGSLDHFGAIGWWPYVAALAIAIPLFVKLGLYRAIVRYMGGKALVTVLLGVTLTSILMLALDASLQPRRIPYASLVIFWALATIYTAGSRALVRYLFFSRAAKGGLRERVIIYGAGDAGARLSALLKEAGDYLPVAFVDDKRALQHSHINGITVYPPAELQQLISSMDAKRILLAVPGASRRRRQEILTSIGGLGAHVQSLPDLMDLISGKAKIDDIREVEVNDLLGRDPVPPNHDLLRSTITGKAVMVTGAGGSIGSELCRQILSLEPRVLVLFEMSELALYKIEDELRQLAKASNCSVELLPLLGNSHHKSRVREIMQSCGVQTVYHAAAYKHVPIVEHNVIDGVHNNVFSTWYTAEAALETSVETFVLISTDKAVNPANVMGATKRFAELVLQGLQQRPGGRTRFCMVRFGNVLDSSGSVVPRFREQIRAGGPVTVTHPDVIRYFMTIPEAAQLVIQAGAMATGGDVFVLDMGRPVRIDDLARRMVLLMGLTIRDEENPEGDIEIKYTGLRTAEKLYEELLIGSNVAGTDHPRIMRAMEHALPWEQVHALLTEILDALMSYDCRQVLTKLSEAVAEYKVYEETSDLIWSRKSPVVRADSGRISTSKIAVLPKRKATDKPLQS